MTVICGYIIKTLYYKCTCTVVKKNAPDRKRYCFGFVFIFIDCSCNLRLNDPNFASFEQHFLPARGPFELKTYPVRDITWNPVAADDFLHPGTEVAVFHFNCKSQPGACYAMARGRVVAPVSFTAAAAVSLLLHGPLMLYLMIN